MRGGLAALTDQAAGVSTMPTPVLEVVISSVMVALVTVSTPPTPT